MHPTDAADDRQPRYPGNYAFVVQFQHASARSIDPAGRIEHVASGRAGRFEGGAELMAFVLNILTVIENEKIGPAERGTGTEGPRG